MASIRYYGGSWVVTNKTTTLICHDPEAVITNKKWFFRNPMNYATTLLYLQLIVISLTSKLMDFCLQPLGQSSIVSEIFGGIVYGPSLLGHEGAIASGLFPMRGNMVIETIANFGIMFFFFEMGVKTDMGLMLRPGRLAIATGAFVTLSTLALAVSLCFLLKSYAPMDASVASSLPFIAVSQCLTPLPNIVCLLTELKIINTDIGRLAIASSVFADLLGAFFMAISYSQINSTNKLNSWSAFLSTLALLAVIVLVFRPAFLWVQSHTSERKGVSKIHVNAIFIAVLLVSFVSEVIGQHFTFGPLMLGLVVPVGPPLGAALVEKLKSLISGLLYPSYLTVSGLKTNIFKIHLRPALIVLFVVFSAGVMKMIAVLIIGNFSGLPIREGLVLGLLLNAKGVTELAVYNLWKNEKVLADQEFTLCVISVIAVTAIIMPLIRVLYDPSKCQLQINRRTIQQAKHDEELTILVCIHNQDNVPTIVNLLEASCATKDSPIAVVALLLVELVGRAVPMLIAHESKKKLETDASMSRSDHIINALHLYKLHNEGFVTLRTFSAISYLDTMHEDIYRIALNQNATILILPFHKYWAIDGSVGSVNRAIQNMNIKVLERAACSVGIFIDRGILGGTSSIINSQLEYRVAVLYIGGQDDSESLSYATRMVNHSNVTLTVIRILLFGSDNAKDRKFDNELINEVRHANLGNERFSYEEEVVRDGKGLSECLRGLEKCFNLIMVGRQHQESLLLQGFGMWSECPELGIVGDFLASPDFRSTASVLVVQQQRIGRRLINQKATVIDTNIPF